MALNPSDEFITAECVLGVAFGYWVYRCPKFFANWFWIKRWLLPSSGMDNNPPAKFVSFFRMLGLISLWANVFFGVVYWILRILGVSIVEPDKPPPAI